MPKWALLPFLCLRDLPRLFLEDGAYFLLHGNGLLRCRGGGGEWRLHHRRQRKCWPQPHNTTAAFIVVSHPWPLPLATSASLQGELSSPRRVTFDLRVPLPVSLFHWLLLCGLAHVPCVVQREEQKVPVGGEPSQGEGCIEGLESQSGELRGAGPGGTHAEHNSHAPEDLPQLLLRACPGVPVRPSASLCPSWRLGLCRARGLPGALLPWRREGVLSGSADFWLKQQLNSWQPCGDRDAECWAMLCTVARSCMPGFLPWRALVHRKGSPGQDLSTSFNSAPGAF